MQKMQAGSLSEDGRWLDDLLEFIAFSNKFRSTQRLIWYRGNPNRELDGDHSFQIAFVAWYVISRFELKDLDLLSTIAMALIHDLPEVYAGDTPAFKDSTGSIPSKMSRASKKTREAAAIARIEQEWGQKFPEMVGLLKRYERQECLESRLVYTLEKLVSTANIYLDDGTTWKRLRVTLEELDKYKWPRVGAHNFVAQLYDELVRRMAREPNLFPTIE